MILLSVIIPTYKDWPRLLLCLKSLEKQSFPKEEFEVIVVNNDEGDEFPEEVLKYCDNGNFYFKTEPRAGSYVARNKGLQFAQGKYLAFTDSDCIVDVDWVKNIISSFGENQSLSRIGGRIDIHNENGHDGNAATLHEKVFAFKQKVSCSEGVSVTANMATKASVLKAVGLFNAKLKSGGDFEWAKRADALGFKIEYRDEVIVSHPARTKAALVKKAKRIAGGNFDRGSESKIRLLLNYLTPPVNTIVGVFKLNDKTIIEKVKISYIVGVLRVHGLAEFMRLLCGGVSKRD